MGTSHLNTWKFKVLNAPWIPYHLINLQHCIVCPNTPKKHILEDTVSGQFTQPQPFCQTVIFSTSFIMLHCKQILTGASASFSHKDRQWHTEAGLTLPSHRLWSSIQTRSRDYSRQKDTISQLKHCQSVKKIKFKKGIKSPFMGLAALKPLYRTTSHGQLDPD